MAEPWTGLPSLRQTPALLEPMQQVDVGGAYEALNKAIGQVSGQIRKVVQPIMNDQAQEAGARSVTRDENGVLQVDRRFEFEEQDAVFNNAAEASYLSQLGLDMRSNFMDLRSQENLQLDPAAFRVAAEGLLEGTLSSVPAGFRGAAASLFNQELARNMDDIAGKAESARFKKQESALKAGIESSQNDVFRLAEAGGLNTPEGIQAVQTYIAATRQQENPIWGVSGEEIQQQIEGTLSIAKGYAARGAIISIYKSKGIEAAQAATRQMLSDGSMNLTIGQRHALESDIMGEIGNMESLARSRRAEAATYATANRAANDAALDAEISDYVTFGAGDPEKYKALRDKISRSYESGAINPSSYGSAISKLNTGMREAADKAEKTQALITGAFTRITSGAGFNPNDTDEMKQLEAAWPLIAKDLAPEAVLPAARQFAQQYGAIPPQVVEQLKPGLYAAGSPDRIVDTSLQVMQLYNANNAATNAAFGTAEVQRAAAVEEAHSKGYPNADAVDMVTKLEKVSPEERSRRMRVFQEQWKAPAKSGDPAGPQRTAALAVLSNMGVDVEALQKTQPLVLERALSDAQQYSERTYTRMESDKAAGMEAERVLTSTWGTTMWGRPTGEKSMWSIDPRAGLGVEIYQPEGVSLGFLPPEVVYGAGLPKDQAFAYQALDLTAVMLQNQIDPKEYGLSSWGEIGRVEPENVGTVMPDGGMGYRLMTPSKKYILAADGSPLIWQPDVTGAKAFAERVKAETLDLARRSQNTNSYADDFKAPELPGTMGIMQGGRN